MKVAFCGHSQLKINYKIKDKLEEILIKLTDDGRKLLKYKNKIQGEI